MDDSDCTGLIEQEVEDNYQVEQDSNGRYRTSFHVPSIFFSYLIGSKGSTRKRLEAETRTTINIPKMGCKGDIVITGSEKKFVCTARNRINMLVITVRKKQKMTHFLSVPLTDDIFVQRFIQFKKDVLEICPGIDENIFIYPSCLHMTVTIFKLFDNVERDEVCTALDYCHKNIIPKLLAGKKDLRVRIQGLDIMNDDPSAVKVLFAKVTSLGDSMLLQNLLTEIRKYFITQGLSADRGEHVLIHATLMNTKFLSADDSLTEDKNKVSKTFDASAIFEKFKDYNFGEACISKMELSIANSTVRSVYWKASAVIDLFKF